MASMDGFGCCPFDKQLIDTLTTSTRCRVEKQHVQQRVQVPPVAAQPFLLEQFIPALVPALMKMIHAQQKIEPEVKLEFPGQNDKRVSKDDNENKDAVEAEASSSCGEDDENISGLRLLASHVRAMHEKENAVGGGTPNSVPPALPAKRTAHPPVSQPTADMMAAFDVNSKKVKAATLGGEMPPAKKQKGSPVGTPMSKKVEADRPTPPKGATDNNTGKDGADRKAKARKLGKVEEDGSDKSSGKTQKWGVFQEASRSQWIVRTGFTSKMFGYKKDGDSDKAHKAAKEYFASCPSS